MKNFTLNSKIRNNYLFFITPIIIISSAVINCYYTEISLPYSFPSTLSLISIAVLFGPISEEIDFRFLFPVITLLSLNVLFDFRYYLKSKDFISLKKVLKTHWELFLSGNKKIKEDKYSGLFIWVIYGIIWAMGHSNYGGLKVYATFLDGILYILIYYNFGILTAILAHLINNFLGIITYLNIFPNANIYAVLLVIIKILLTLVLLYMAHTIQKNYTFSIFSNLFLNMISIFISLLYYAILDSQGFIPILVIIFNMIIIACLLYDYFKGYTIGSSKLSNL